MSSTRARTWRAVRKSSIRGKLTLALLVTGLTSAALVGLIARSILLNQFTTGLRENSFRMFQADIVAYVSKYGSWDAAMRAEPFGQFQHARLVPGSGPPRFGAPPPRPGGGRGGSPPPPPPGGTDPNAPPFRFLLLDPGGRVLMGPEEFPPRQPAPEPLRRQGRPIRVNGAVVAYAVPLDQPNLTETDHQYLDATQNAVTYGVLGAAVLALLLGFFFSGRLSRNLRRLTTAIQAMGQGDLQQHVDVQSRDEIGFLAQEFNRMSAELSRAHRELQESHDKIREQALRLEELSVRDELTQLHNRRYFNVQAGLAFAQAERYRRPFTVALGDVDHFKKINDGYSHAIGDEVLRRVGRILIDGTRESDVVARFGGEEFVIAFTETPLREALATCERIRSQIEQHPWDEVHPGLRVTMTLGVDAGSQRGSMEAMLAAADARLYEGKAAGRNCVRGDAAQVSAS